MRLLKTLYSKMQIQFFSSGVWLGAWVGEGRGEGRWGEGGGAGKLVRGDLKFR